MYVFMYGMYIYMRLKAEVYVYICMYVLYFCVRMYMYVCMFVKYSNFVWYGMYVFMYVCMVCMYVYAFKTFIACMCVRCVCMYVCMYV